MTLSDWSKKPEIGRGEIPVTGPVFSAQILYKWLRLTDFGAAWKTENVLNQAFFRMPIWTVSTFVTKIDG